MPEKSKSKGCSAFVLFKKNTTTLFELQISQLASHSVLTFQFPAKVIERVVFSFL